MRHIYTPRRSRTLADDLRNDVIREWTPFIVIALLAITCVVLAVKLVDARHKIAASEQLYGERMEFIVNGPEVTP